jgi:hypothetical protein
MSAIINVEPMPAQSDPRWRFLFILFVYVTIGITLLGFNRSPAQILAVLALGCTLEMVFHFLFKKRTLIFPLSAAISSLSLGILLNYAHGIWLPLVPVFVTIASKYVFTHNGKHVYNPSLFGVVFTLLFANDMITAAPAYQWGGSIAIAIFVVTAALVLFVGNIKRTALIVSFLSFYLLATALRAYLTRFHVPPETLFIGAISSPAFYLFAFFMITDPKTSPDSPRMQVLMAFLLVVVDLLMHKFQALTTFFFAAFTCFTGRFLFLHAKDLIAKNFSIRHYARAAMPRFVIVALTFTAIWTYQKIPGHGIGWAQGTITPHLVTPLQFTELQSSETGVSARPGDILEKVDPKIANVGKWLLSVGDAAAVADVDGDGLQDFFLTNPLKHPEDRAALYRNLGGLKFKRTPLPALDDMIGHEKTKGLISGAVFFDYDNDEDQDLLILTGYGFSRLLKNELREKGTVGFIDVSNELGISDYNISVAANVFDYDRDGRLDIFLANAMTLNLPGYDPPVRFNLFDLPEPAYNGDRRMLNVMHRTWHDANNGGENFLYKNIGNGFQKQNMDAMGLAGTRWTLAVGSGDLNNDGFPDLYLANDFGPDELFLNQGGSGFKLLSGSLVGELSRDTYKGMNATFADFDNNGFQDIYVSNVHVKLQAEGSLLWMNDGKSKGYKAFKDRAVARNALNEKRFGWGAAAGDLDLDGRLDIVQANGHLDDNYDKKFSSCPDYWYWNEKIALTRPAVHGYADKWADLRGMCIFPNEKNRVYLNAGRQFVDVAEQVGLGRPGASRAVALADLDNDGDLDVIVTRMTDTPSIYKNELQTKHWVGIDLVGNGSTCNSDAIGTIVTISPGTENMQRREKMAVNGLSSQSDGRLLFGIPSLSDAVQAEVDWCGHGQKINLVLTPGRYYRVQQKEGLITTLQGTKNSF